MENQSSPRLTLSSQFPSRSLPGSPLSHLLGHLVKLEFARWFPGKVTIFSFCIEPVICGRYFETVNIYFFVQEEGELGSEEKLGVGYGWLGGHTSLKDSFLFDPQGLLAILLSCPYSLLTRISSPSPGCSDSKLFFHCFLGETVFPLPLYT